jgi:hypothetical protein
VSTRWRWRSPDYPDLIDRRGVITEAAFDEAIRRLERS